VLAHLTRTRGNKGELCSIPLADDRERLQKLKTVYLNGTAYEVEAVWYHKEQPIFKFRGVDSISDGEKLAGVDVCVPRSERPELPEGEFYFSDLIGCRMVDDAAGELIGIVSGWQELSAGGQVLLEVDEGRGIEPLLVPYASAVLKKIDVAARELRATLPEGLRELNSEPPR
jgi:16S rRNA processing protein RimM